MVPMLWESFILTLCHKVLREEKAPIGILMGHDHGKSQIEVHLLCESKQSVQSAGCKALDIAMACFTTPSMHQAKHLKSKGMSFSILEFPKTHINIINSPTISKYTHPTSDFWSVFCEFYLLEYDLGKILLWHYSPFTFCFLV